MTTAIALALSAGLSWAGPVTLRADDGVTLQARSSGSGATGVVLVHDDGRSAEDWTPFAEKLSDNGLHVVALDLRGHGASARGTPPDEAAYPLMVKDVSAATAWLRARGAGEVMVVGAGLGANLALNAAALDDQITGVALLSPSANLRGVKVSAAIEAYGTRPLLLVADEGDTLPARVALLLSEKARGPSELALYPGAGSGARMLNAAPALEPLLLGWLKGSWHAAAEAQQRAMKTNELGEVDTTGTKLEDR